MTTPPTPPAPNSPSEPAASGRGRKPGVPAKARADIPADEMQLNLLPAKAQADLRRKREERKDQQKAVDQIVYDVFEENVSRGFGNGTIANWADLFVYDWPITKTHAETALFLINKAARFYSRKPIFGEQLEVPAGKSHKVLAPTEKDPENMVDCHLNGKAHVHIPFTIVRRPTRQRSA